MSDYLPELHFSLMLILSQLSPGPDQALVTRTSLLYGFKAGLVVTLGISCGIVVHAILTVTMGTALLQSRIGAVFYFLAGCWLIYLAWKIWPKKVIVEQGMDSASFRQNPNLPGLYKDALLCNLLNPKCTLFLVSLSAPLLKNNPGGGYDIFFVCLVIVVGGLSWINWVIAFQWKPIRRFYASHMVAIDRVFSIALLAFGMFLLIPESVSDPQKEHVHDTVLYQ